MTLVKSLELESLTLYPDLLKKYLKGDSLLDALYTFKPNEIGLKEAIDNRRFSDGNRKILVDYLRSSSWHVHEAQIDSIDQLSKPNTYTITTGHQLNLATGPLYFIYKIISTIRLVEQLSSKFPSQKFVPVYWMASEDHDVTEISELRIFGKQYLWETDQKGPVGRMVPPGEEFWSKIPDIPFWMLEAYTKSLTLAEAHAKIVSHIFGSYGLIILEPDHSSLKKQFTPFVEKELIHQSSLLALEKSEKTLQDLNYSTQISGRPINLFFVETGIRERIVFTDSGNYEVLNTELKFSSTELLKLVHDSPEKFSPNVVLRPLYQETILPNIAYIGGPAEVHYWLQLKPVFEQFHIPMPVVLPRNFALIVQDSLQKKLTKLGLEVSDLLDEFIEVKRKWLNAYAGEQLDFDDEVKQLNQVYNSLSNKSKNIDGSLNGWIEAERSKAEKQLEYIEKRLKKALESKQDIQIQQLAKVYEKLMPDGGLQERKDNVLSYLINYPDFIKELHAHLQPLDFKFHMVFLDGMH